MIKLFRGGFCTVLLPLLLSWVAAGHPAVWSIALFMLSHLLILWLTPLYRGSENLWLFALLSVTAHPLNLRLMLSVMLHADLFDTNLPMAVMRCLTVLCALFSAEQLSLGVIVRMIWRNQKSL